MRFTIHTPDGETYTTPEDAYPIPDNEGTGALHIIQSGSDRTIAMFPAGQWTRYVPAEEEEVRASKTEQGSGNLTAYELLIDTIDALDYRSQFVTGLDAYHRYFINLADKWSKTL